MNIDQFISYLKRHLINIMQAIIDSKAFSKKYRNYQRNYPILFKYLSYKIISHFLKDYINFLLNDNDIYINKLLLRNKLIDKCIFDKLEEEKLSIIELARITEFELAEILEISKRKSYMIKILAQFHFVNLFNRLTIYYAHPKAKYIDSIENAEMKVIHDYFPFSIIVNPSILEKLWRKNSCSSSQIMERCLKIVSNVDLVIFSPLNDQYISKGVYDYKRFKGYCEEIL